MTDEEFTIKARNLSMKAKAEGVPDWAVGMFLKEKMQENMEYQKQEEQYSLMDRNAKSAFERQQSVPQPTNVGTGERLVDIRTGKEIYTPPEAQSWDDYEAIANGINIEAPSDKNALRLPADWTSIPGLEPYNQQQRYLEAKRTALGQGSW